MPATIDAGGTVRVEIWNAGATPAVLRDPGGSNGCAVRSGHAVTLRASDGLLATSYATPADAACTMVFVPPSEIEVAPGQSVEWTSIATAGVFPMTGPEGGAMSVGGPVALTPGRYQVTGGPGLRAALEVR